MYNYMGRSNKTLLIMVSITTFCIRCYGTISNISQTNWANAHMHCREEGKMLPKLLIHTLSNESFFWTGHYTRLSEWIKIIGCFEESVVNTLTRKSYHMYFPSAGRCQEVCLSSNYSVFGIQLNKCVCLEKIPGQRSIGARYCSSSCSGNYAAETNITFQNDCGGSQTYNIFKSGSEMENSAFTAYKCLSIQCGDIKFIEQECNTNSAQICKETLYTKYQNWQSSSAECKSEHNSYLLGDIDLTEPKKACTLIKEKPVGPSWIGIAKEVYMSKAEDKDDMVRTERNPIRCLKCNSNKCTSADCKEFNYYVCIERPGTTSTAPTTRSTTLHGTVSTSTSPTGTAKSTSPHGTVSTSTTPTGTTKSTSPHGTVSTSTTPTGTTTSTSPHGTVSTSTKPTGTTTSTSPHGTVSNSTTPTATTTSTPTHGTISTEHSRTTIFKATEGSTNKKRESMINKQDGNTAVIMVVVPVIITVIVILGFIALLFVILWRRRQTKKTADTKHAHHEPNLHKHSEKSDTNHSLRNNYFILDKTETYSVFNSVNHAKDKGCKSPYKECNDDDYDHLGENVREDVKEEDNYHHAFFPSNKDESDYGTCIRNITAECLMESPYSHTNRGDHHVALADNEYSTISVNA